jgi:hypothetical protein
MAGGAKVGNLTLTGSANIDGTGNVLDDGVVAKNEEWRQLAA